MDNNKYKNFVFTWNAEDSGSLVDSEDLKSFLKSYSQEYLFQKEVGEETNREHYQGYFILHVRKRKKTILNDFQLIFENIQNLTIAPMQGTVDQNKSYCMKTEGEVYTNKIIYKGDDVNFLDDETKRYPWQADLYKIFFEDDILFVKSPESTRQIIWVYDSGGNSGKSLFTKWLCFRNSDVTKIAFGSAQQLRSAIVSVGPRLMYIIDIPRTLGEDDSLKNIYSVIEDIKNGYVVSSFYGTHKEIMMTSPHVLIFSNSLPDTKYLSRDRWIIKVINYKKEMSNYEFFD